jgi:hypothetical protein
MHRKVARLVRDRLPFSRSHFGRFRPWFTRLARVFFMGTGALSAPGKRGNSCA